MTAFLTSLRSCANPIARYPNTLVTVALSTVILVFAVAACRGNDSPEAWLEDEDEMIAVDDRDADRPDRLRLTHPAMAAEFQIVAYPRTEDESPLALVPVFEEAFSAIDDVEDRFSTWRATSQATYVNNHAANRPVRVSRDFFDKIEYAKTMWEATDGAFDLTVGPLMRLWGRYEDLPAVPEADEIAQVIAEIGMDKITLDPEERTIAFESDQIALDFSGIGKGYAVDRAVEVLQRHGVEAALVDGGTSSMRAIGAPPGRDGWRVSVRDPYEPDVTMDMVTLKDESLGASGCFRNLMVAGEEEVCDIIDPRTGYPVEDMLSVTVIAGTATETDVLATAFMVMGPDGIRAYCEQDPDVRALYLPMPDNGEVTPERVNF